MPIMPMPLPCAGQSGLISIGARIDRPQTPPGISAPLDVVGDDVAAGAQHALPMCDNDLGWDEDVGWDEEDEMGSAARTTHGTRLAAVEAAIVSIAATQKEQGEAQREILALLKRGPSPSGDGGPRGSEGGTAHHPNHTEILKILNALGPWGSVVFVYLLVRGHI